MKCDQNDLRSQCERCERELAECERLLRSGHPDIEGLCRAISDWSGELHVLREKAVTTQPSCQPLADELRQIVALHEWTGKVTDLVMAPNQAGTATAPSAAHLAIWLRRKEPTLWWDYGVRVRFSRTGKQRRVHLSRKDG